MLKGLSLFVTMLILSTSNLNPVPSWVPKEKAAAFDRVLKDAKDLADILDAAYVVTGCKVDSGNVYVQGKRGILVFEAVIDVQDVVKGCNVDGGKVEFIYEEGGSSRLGMTFEKMLYGAGGVGIGILIGILLRR